ncbi:putative receptor-like serine/threonine-protein kinase [Zea mays]|uniref:Putative receptor-like serine/threonine-protein kinase n=1 Tax=Zea mays TaxID=4577 RepID=A0A317YGW8_MAIZE|nr:putative receptor-like serine/threonine-protein kinase [Zea mays]
MAADHGEGVGRCILVGLHMDAVGRDLLQWALHQEARRGDRIVAVHIYRKSDKTNTLKLIRTLDDYLAEYEALCNQKQVVLVGRVTPGSSIQKELVKEAKLCAAMVVVLGANKKYSFGGSSCLAKYCAKKLPPTTTVVAIQDGRAVFVREAPRPPLGAEPKPVLRTVLHPSVGLEPKVIIPNPNRSARSMSMDLDAPCCGHGAADASASKCLDDATKGDGDVAPEQRLGWPLLRRAHAAAAASAAPVQTPGGKNHEPRKQSVVHWVMSLPRRSAPSESAEPHAGAGLESELKAMLGGSGARCRWFRYEELYDSTNHFSAENLIGNGGNSRVYRGSLACGRQVAIKLCKASAEASKDFLREVDIITKLQHHRIVPLIGVCVEGRNLISVYRYLPRGSLEDNLHGERSKPALSWENRYKAALGIAEALSYLHSGSPRPVIHRDVKSSNILLAEEFEPQLSDFGLAIWAPTNPTSVTHSDVVGTFGYLAPEYFMYGKVTDRVDVYALGVVLLELLSGRKSISSDGSSPKGQESLVMWATPVLSSGNICDLLDPRLDVKHDEVEVRRMASAASLCLRRSARLRPPISQILSILRGESAASIADQGATEPDCVDDEAYPAANVRSHLGLALLDVEDSESISSTEHSSGLSPLEEYLRERWSRSSSFD